MPTTPNGTLYTTVNATPAGGDRTLVGFPDTATGETGVPLVLYTHGNGANFNQFAAIAAWDGLRNWMIDNGWAWVESAGGGPSSWGNQAARDSYEAALGYADSVLDVGPVVVLARSMGGLVGYWLATQSSVVAPRTVGLIVNSGTTDLAHRFTVDQEPTLLAAFDATNADEFATNTVGFDPMLFPIGDWAGLPVLQMYGTADTSVPPDDHALPWIAKYGATAEVTVDVREGGDHSGINGSYLQVDAMADFLTAVTPPPPPPPKLAHRILSMYVTDAHRNLHRVTPG